MTYDKKCFNVYKTKCQDGYDEGKVNDPEINRILYLEHDCIDIFHRASDIRSIVTSSL